MNWKLLLLIFFSFETLEYYTVFQVNNAYVCLWNLTCIGIQKNLQITIQYKIDHK